MKAIATVRLDCSPAGIPVFTFATSSVKVVCGIASALSLEAFVFLHFLGGSSEGANIASSAVRIPCFTRATLTLPGTYDLTQSI